MRRSSWASPTSSARCPRWRAHSRWQTAYRRQTRHSPSEPRSWCGPRCGPVYRAPRPARRRSRMRRPRPPYGRDPWFCRPRLLARWRCIWSRLWAARCRRCDRRDGVSQECAWASNPLPWAPGAPRRARGHQWRPLLLFRHREPAHRSYRWGTWIGEFRALPCPQFLASSSLKANVPVESLTSNFCGDPKFVRYDRSRCRLDPEYGMPCTRM